MSRALQFMCFMLAAGPCALSAQDLPTFPRLGEVLPAAWVDEFERTGSLRYFPRIEGCEDPEWAGGPLLEEFMARDFEKRLSQQLAAYLSGAFALCPRVRAVARPWYLRQLDRWADDRVAGGLGPFLRPLEVTPAAETIEFLLRYVEDPRISQETRDRAVEAVLASRDQPGIRAFLELAFDGRVSPGMIYVEVGTLAGDAPGRLMSAAAGVVRDRPEVAAGQAGLLRMMLEQTLRHPGGREQVQPLLDAIQERRRGGNSNIDETLIEWLRERGLVPSR